MTPTKDRQIRLENAELLRGLVDSVEAMRADVGEISKKVIIIEARDHGAQITALAARVALLEAADQRREGAAGILAALLKSPTLGWMVGAATAIWAVVAGKVDL